VGENTILNEKIKSKIAKIKSNVKGN